MIKIIETNLHEDGFFQSRVIEVESWDYVINLFTNDTMKGIKCYKSILGNYIGEIRPRRILVTKLVYNYDRLYCEFRIFNNKLIKKFIQRIN